MSKSKSIAILGANGFIGSNLSSYLLTKGFNVVKIGRNLGTNRQELSFSIDVANTSQLMEVLIKVDVIVWLVSNLVPSSKPIDSISEFSDNTKPFIDLLASLSDSGLKKKLLFLSSGGTIYGEGKNILKESDALNPISNYGLNKLILEKYLEFYVRKSENLKAVILRVSNVYGPNQNFSKPQGIVGYAIRSIISKEKLVIYGNGSIIRDFIFIDDLSNAILKCIEMKLTNNTVNIFNISSGKGIAVSQILKTIELISEKPLIKEFLPARSFDCKKNILDNSKFAKRTGWMPNIDIQTGISIVYNSIFKN